MPIVGQDAATKRILADIQKVRDRVQNMGNLLKKLGALGVAESQKAFRESKLGEHTWKVRYPSQPEPFINIAGAIADWNDGATSPRPVQFDREPPLIGHGQSGGLWGSLSWKSSADAVRWGTDKKYARPHQEGLETEQTVTADAKQKMYDWFYGKRGERRRTRVGVRLPLTVPVKEVVYEHKRGKGGGFQTVRVEKIRKTQFVPAGYVGEGEDVREARRNDYLDKFGWLLNAKTRNQPTVVVTRVAKRPFVGMTEDLERNMREAIKRHVEEGR